MAVTMSSNSSSSVSSRNSSSSSSWAISDSSSNSSWMSATKAAAALHAVTTPLLANSVVRHQLSSPLSSAPAPANKVKRKRQPAIALARTGQPSLLGAVRTPQDRFGAVAINDPLASEEAFRQFLAKVSGGTTPKPVAPKTPSPLSPLQTLSCAQLRQPLPSPSRPHSFLHDSHLVRELHALERSESAFVRALRQLRDHYQRPLAITSGNQIRPTSLRYGMSSASSTLDWLVPSLRDATPRHVPSNMNAGSIVDALFAHVTPLIRLHAVILGELRALCGSVEVAAHDIVALFNAQLPHLEIYVDFVEQQTEALVAFENLCFYDESFRRELQLLDAAAETIANAPSLYYLLRRPREHLRTYVTFLETLLEESLASRISHAQTDDVAVCLLAVEDIQERTRKWVGRLQHVDRLAQIQGSMTQLPEPLLTRDQMLMYEGNLRLLADQQVSGRAVALPVHGWLFGDRLVLARRNCANDNARTGNTRSFTCKESIHLACASVCALLPSKQPVHMHAPLSSSTYASASFVAASADAHGAFQLDLGEQVTTLLANNTREFHAWRAALSEVMQSYSSSSSSSDGGVQRFLVM
ncbi:hypothetical protein THASP1DRAFT_24710 [Thamnocephalis sphaerospora]|uniref:DH domain-containing protein n=1 Tax=Thamnocephalis sphaerospora TaxID=78915 RepID=A0A4P9XMP5_9FUNG|nr:hypothetical protein THASP1DRAFT_24710 [Thamnocephalis sphaerospora]|eukprot:RKP07072.1 hypothetical protein THASP1DRAFT_24710 [Thamnocephalis sphaerospora]